MIDLPIGKALVAYEAVKKCDLECTRNENYECTLKLCCVGCQLNVSEIRGKIDDTVCDNLCCFDITRHDGKNVFYKIVDYPFK